MQTLQIKYTIHHLNYKLETFSHDEDIWILFLAQKM